MKKIRQIIETVRIKLRRLYIGKTANIRAKKIKNKDFTIISNNCWGGFIYQSYNIKYNTPTIGCFFMAKDYIKFISDIKKYLDMELISIEPQNSKWYNLIKNKSDFGTYPVATLGDIEIHFLHYKTFEDARDKWNTRKKRINFNNVIYKFSEMNNCEREDIINFQKLNLENKICFVSKKFKDLENNYTFSLNKKVILASYEPFGNSRRVNINKAINNITNKI